LPSASWPSFCRYDDDPGEILGEGQNIVPTVILGVIAGLVAFGRVVVAPF
jgi:hypothetical protein